MADARRIPKCESSIRSYDSPLAAPRRGGIRSGSDRLCLLTHSPLHGLPHHPLAMGGQVPLLFLPRVPHIFHQLLDVPPRPLLQRDRQLPKDPSGLRVVLGFDLEDARREALPELVRGEADADAPLTYGEPAERKPKGEGVGRRGSDGPTKPPKRGRCVRERSVGRSPFAPRPGGGADNSRCPFPPFSSFLSLTSAAAPPSLPPPRRP